MYAHPSMSLLFPAFSRDDLFLVTFCIADDWMKARFGSCNVPRKGRGPRNDEFSDSETLTVLLVGELCHVRRERAWLRQVRSNHLSLFPHLPEDSRFSRRAQKVRWLLGELRRTIMFWADADLESGRIVDTFPMPLCSCCRVGISSQPISGSAFGYNSSKRCWYFGLRPGIIITPSGYIEDICLSPGNCNDTPFLANYLDQRIELGLDVSGQDWFMDKGFISIKLAKIAKEKLALNLLVRQRNKPGEQPSAWQQFIDKTRRPIERVLSVLTECFGIEHILARSDIGLFRRVQAKATAFSLARYFNHMIDRPPMDIAAYAV